jgi:hypothetical protein
MPTGYNKIDRNPKIESVYWSKSRFQIVKVVGTIGDLFGQLGVS